MKKTVFFSLLAIMLAFGFIGCMYTGDEYVYMFETFGGFAGGEVYKLYITNGSTFELKIGDLTIGGTAIKNGGRWDLTITSGGSGTLSVEVSGIGINGIDGYATIQGGNTIDGPIVVTPAITLTGIYQMDEDGDFIRFVFSGSNLATVTIFDGDSFSFPITYAAYGSILSLYGIGWKDHIVTAIISNDKNSFEIPTQESLTMLRPGSEDGDDNGEFLIGTYTKR